MTVTGNPSARIQPRCGAVFGPLLSSRRYLIHNGTLVNTKRAIIERVFCVKNELGILSPPPVPKSKGLFLRRLFPERNALVNHPVLKPWSISQVLDLWSGSKRAVYQRAHDSLLVSGISRKDSYLKAFVKCEKIDASKHDPAPRIIQPRSARYNLELAAYLKPYEKEFYKRVDLMFDTDGLGDKTIFKGMNSAQAAENLILKASRFSNPVFVGLDASRFDQHVSRIALEWEHSIYMDSFAFGHRKLKSLLEWQVFNRGRAYLKDGTIKYAVEGRRMSGDMNTSLGNCIIMSSLCHSYLRSKNLSKFALANNGDDCVIIVERGQLGAINDLGSWFLEMGFNVVREAPVYDIREVSFCQVNVLTSPGYNLSVRNPNTVLSKDLHSAYPFTHEHQYNDWLIASGECGRNSHYGIPVLEQFYNCFPTGNISDAGIRLELENWKLYSIVGGARKIPISDEMRHSFWVAFGITPDAQIALENELARITYGTRHGPVSYVPYCSLLQGISN